MADTNITWNGTPIDDIERDSLSLSRINENGTIREMVDTINANFLNIAKHGGGPAGMDGSDGSNGVDGSNVEYIYALCDEMNPDVQYPTDTYERANLFNSVKSAGSYAYKGVTWFDNAQPISPDYKNEYVWSRIKRGTGLTEWYYASEPVLWSHWGETGQDGDGVEYIFLASSNELTSISLESSLLKIENMDDFQKVIFNIDDFYPGKKWFENGDNKQKVRTAISKKGLEISESIFDTRWKEYFNFCNDTYSWTDEPTGTGPSVLYEYVSIRKSTTDKNDIKTWGDFSTPALWSNYNLPTKTAIIYCNLNETETPKSPKGGWYDISKDKLVTNKVGYELTPNYWKDTNEDAEENQITWMCTGVFDHTGENAYWSSPVRITGSNGKNGEDGTLIEFIYALTTYGKEPEYPTLEEELDELFNAVEKSDATVKFAGYGSTKWYDRAQPISIENPVEYMAQRSKKPDETKWTYTGPIIWAHWGEDGTDGDGVEYIYATTVTNSNSGLELPVYSSLNDSQKKIFQIDDFVPSTEWFGKPKSKNNAKKVLGESFNETEWNNYYDFNVSPGWSDNPVEVGPSAPYQWVSIRRSRADENNGKRFWEDFSTPVLWNSYGKRTRSFIVYCNMPNKTTPELPTGGWWDTTDDALWISKTNENEYKSNALSSGEPIDGSNVGYWSDKNIDVSGTITWISTGEFSDSIDDNGSNNISWSAPFRITGETGRPGADGSTIEFVYCLSEEMPAFPNESYEEKCAFFDEVEKAGTNGYKYNETTTWFDNPQGISNEDGKRKEWVWSRSKSAVIENESTADWTFPKSPVVWSHWGEDGTDGDGVEYIFIVKNEESYPDNEESKENWNNNWTVFTDTNASVTAKAIYAMDDFCPRSSWFDNNKDNVKASMENPSKDFDENVWTQILTNMSSLGNWTDNPENISATNKYQYVSIRKMNNGVWGAFSYPKLWAKYNLTSFKAFAFTSTPVSVELGNLTFLPGISGTIDNPLPIDEKHIWADGPEPTEENPQVWMTSATIHEDNLGNTTWAKPQRMTDNAELQVEWSSDDITGNLLADKILALADNQYNFGNFFTGDVDEDTAEDNWRKAVKDGLQLTFGDSSNNAVLMATCHKTNGKWSNWDLVRVKGETGEAGTSINMKTPIIYEVYLDDNNYTIENARTKFNEVKSTLTTPTPYEGYLAIVYPHDMNANDIYHGDSNLGNALYMCKYNGSSWVEYFDEETVSTNEIPGDTHPSPNGHLILWDGDSWMDAGKIVGPAGPVSEILVKYAKDGEGGVKEFVPDTEIYTAKYVGFITYPAGKQPDWALDANDENWKWQLFKGQDGFGYEYIFKTTSEYVAPLIPLDSTGGNWSTTPNVIPGNGISDTTNRNYGWVDEPIEPKAESKYVWMCWRKYNHSTQTWTNFHGSGDTDKARLWQVFANTITEVIEYFHADISMSPTDINTPVDDSEYWKTDKSQCGWDANKKYLFNVEVIKFLDGKSQTLDPHLLTVWETGLIDVIDYYILESANGSLGDNDPGENAPHISEYNIPVTSSTNESDVAGKDYWTTSVPKMDKDYPVLWNISKKEYDGGKQEQWTTPIVIGVYGEGKNGEGSIYIDLTNEMDSVQIDNNNNVITERICSTNIKLYKGIELLEIADLDIAGEEAIGDNKDLSSINIQRTYHKGDNQSHYLPVSDCIDITFTIPVGCVLRPSHKIVFTVTSTEGIVRKTGYTLVGTTHSAVYSIVPSASAILAGKNGNDPDSLNITVVKQTGSQLTPISGYDLNQGFKLNYQKNSDAKVELINNPFYISTSGLSAGDKLTFTIDVDTDGNNTYETTLDRETIYVLKEGSDGNGYRYKYIRYDNNKILDYGNTTTCTVTNSSTGPVFKIGTVEVPSNDISDSSMGVDSGHAYEYRSERYGADGSWTDWSDPVIIAKYLDDSIIEQIVDREVSDTTQSIQDSLDKANTRIESFSNKFDEKGNLLLSGSETSAAGVTTFADYINKVTGQFTTITNDINALEGTITTSVTNVAKEQIASGFSEIQADINGEFANMKNTVARGSYVTDVNGYLLAKDTDGTERLAFDKNNNPTKNYTDVRESDKDKLIYVNSELASISQHVSDDGIACTSIITATENSKAVFFIQSDENSGISNIYMDANKVGIHSDYFELNSSGLEMTGNLIAKDENGNITAGVIGKDTADNDLKFFSGPQYALSPITKQKLIRVQDTTNEDNPSQIFVRYPSLDKKSTGRRTDNNAYQLWDEGAYEYNYDSCKYQYYGTFEYEGSTYYMWRCVNQTSLVVLTEERDYTTNNLRYYNANFSLTPKIVASLMSDQEYNGHNANFSYIVYATNDSIYVDDFYDAYAWVLANNSEDVSLNDYYNSSNEQLNKNIVIYTDSENVMTGGTWGTESSTYTVIDVSPSVTDAIKRSTFRVYEDGSIYANQGYIGTAKITSAGIGVVSNDGHVLIGGDGIEIKDKYGNYSIISPSEITLSAALRKRNAYIFDAWDWDNNGNTKVEQLKKDYNVYPTSLINEAFKECDVINTLNQGDSITIPSSASLIGRQITLIGGSALCSVVIDAVVNAGLGFIRMDPTPDTFQFSDACKFYENGGTSSKLTLSNEGVDMIGVGFGNNFKGFVITNRFDISTNYNYGTKFKCLGMFSINKINNNFTIDSYTFNGQKGTISSPSTNSVTISTPFKINNTREILVNISSESGNTTGITYNYNLSKDSNNMLSITVYSSNITKKFKVTVFNFGDFVSLVNDSSEPPAITKKEYSYNSSTWFNLGSTLYFDYDIETCNIRLTVNSAVKKVEYSLQSGSSYFTFTSGSQTTSGNTIVSIGGVSTNSRNLSGSYRKGTIKITLHTSTSDVGDKQSIITIPLEQDYYTQPSYGGGS